MIIHNYEKIYPKGHFDVTVSTDIKWSLASALTSMSVAMTFALVLVFFFDFKDFPKSDETPKAKVILSVVKTHRALTNASALPVSSI